MASPSVRFCVALTSAICMILGVIGIFFMLTAYATFRSEDFVTATITTDMATLAPEFHGTCVESVTDDILAREGINDAGWDCLSDDKKTSLARLLASQVHSLYYLHATMQTPPADLEVVAKSVMSTTLGASESASINFTMAYTILSLLDDDGTVVPASCNEIYKFSNNAVDQNEVVWDTVTSAHANVGCGASAGTNTMTFTATEYGKLLHACKKQFNFGRSGPATGTWGIPLLNEPPGPNYWIWPNVSTFNETASWSTTSRMMLGLRYGTSLWAYVPAIMLVGFLLIDSALMLLVEVTYPNRALDVHLTAEDLGESAEKNAQGWVNYWARRLFRFTITLVGSIVVTIMFVIFVWAPWGASYRLGRPVCEQGKDEEQILRFQMLNPGSRGGWKSDWDCTVLEYSVMIGCWFITLALPASRFLNDGFQPPSGGSSGDDNKVYDNQPQDSGLVSVEEKTGRTRPFAVVIVVAGLLIISGNILVATSFGQAWASSVSGATMPWNEKTLSEVIYDMNLGILIQLMVVGFVLACVCGRHLIDTYSCTSFGVFLLWAILALTGFIVLILSLGLDYFTTQDTHITECKIFDHPDGADATTSNPYEFQRFTCDYRFWVTLVAVLAMLGIIAVMVTFAIIDYAPTWKNTIRRGRVEPSVKVGTRGTKLDGESQRDSVLRVGDTTPGNNAASLRTNFFNWTARDTRKLGRDESTRGLLTASPPPEQRAEFTFKIDLKR